MQEEEYVYNEQQKGTDKDHPRRQSPGGEIDPLASIWSLFQLDRHRRRGFSTR
mgnify:CR=1 FL=1